MTVGLGLLSLGNYTRLEFSYIVVNPGSICRSQSVYSRPVRGTTGITPAHNACQIPQPLHGTRERPPRVTLRKKELCQDRPLASSHPGQPHSALHFPGYACLLLPGKRPCLPSHSQHTACPAGSCGVLQARH